MPGMRLLQSEKLRHVQIGRVWALDVSRISLVHTMVHVLVLTAG